jgi:hypothetical protein
MLATLTLLWLTGCTRQNARPAACEWPPESDRSKPATPRHLASDALRAEDIAIRYADTHFGQRWGHFQGFRAYVEARDRCMAALFEKVAQNHGVTPEQVNEALTHRPLDFDLAVILSFAVLYAFVSHQVARRICRRFPLDEGRTGAVLITAVASFLIAFGGMLAGEEWSVAAETYRIGNDHLSYRALRVPWALHREAFFLAGVALFCLIAALHYRRAQEQPEPTASDTQISWKAL